MSSAWSLPWAQPPHSLELPPWLPSSTECPVGCREALSPDTAFHSFDLKLVDSRILGWKSFSLHSWNFLVLESQFSWGCRCGLGTQGGLILHTSFISALVWLFSFIFN